jgi:NAD(P)-dependent dehydrogenase (short-subunit alcohol dehydrogenase family)
VTGGNSGTGFHTSLELARAGAHVVLAARDEQRGREALERIRAEVPDADVELRPLDLADLESVRRFALGTVDFLDRLDVLVNNAGVMAVPERRTTAQGFELQMGTNHLGHFALTGLLLPALLAARDARVVTVSSLNHRFTQGVGLDDLQSERSYGPWTAYGRSKLANLLFAFELHRRAGAAGIRLASMGAHPGWTATNLQRTGPSLGGGAVWVEPMVRITQLVAMPAAQGALSLLYAATSPAAGSGRLYGPDGLFGARGYPTETRPSRRALDHEEARRLWRRSEELTGVRFDLTSPGRNGG